MHTLAPDRYRWQRALLLPLMAVSMWAYASHGALAQGYQVQSWPAGKPIPALSGSDLQGRPTDLRALRGKAVLINFWASWCEPCVAEMPSLQALTQRYTPDQLVVLAVNYKEPQPTVERFVQRNALRLPVLLDATGESAHAWGATVFPSTVLIRADGRVKGVVRGSLDWAGPQAAALVEPLLPRP